MTASFHCCGTFPSRQMRVVSGEFLVPRSHSRTAKPPSNRIILVIYDERLTYLYTELDSVLTVLRPS